MQRPPLTTKQSFPEDLHSQILNLGKRNGGGNALTVNGPVAAVRTVCGHLLAGGRRKGDMRGVPLQDGGRRFEHIAAFISLRP